MKHGTAFEATLLIGFKPMFSSARKGPSRLASLEKVITWTSERFNLPKGTAIFAAELACALRGCPPLETVISFWDTKGTRYHFKIFKRVADIVPED